MTRGVSAGRTLECDFVLPRIQNGLLHSLIVLQLLYIPVLPTSSTQAADLQQGNAQ
jgi:hypothetical protein